MPPDTQMQEDMDIDNDVDRPSDNDSADDENENTYDDASCMTLDSIPKNKKKHEIPLPLRGSYAGWWTSQKAFREFAQNWRDAIIESNDLTSEDLCVYREAKSVGRHTEIIYKAFQKGSERNDVEQCLGFICYRGRDGAGTVEITNLKATLQPWHLHFGATSKTGHEELAGAHGEGLKIAALVLLRSPQNHHVKCVSGGFRWTFNFNEHGRLVVRLYRIDMARENVQPPRTNPITTPSVVADRDVQFIIGDNWKGRNEDGVEVKRGPVPQTVFEFWTKGALFLREAGNDDTGIISTDYGDLLIAEDLRGSTYLKGLLLYKGTKSRSASVTGQPLRFGYNFARGSTNRERQSLETADDESTTMCRILSSAMKKKPEMIGALVDIFNNTETSYADIACPEKLWPRDIGVLIRDYLLREEFADRWFYCSEDMKKKPELRRCIESIRRKPYEVSGKSWAILRRHNLVRTAYEEALWHLKAAKVLKLPETTFAASVDRLLRACIRACPQTTKVDIRFMQAGQLQLDVAFSSSQPLVYVHQRWLVLQDAIAELGVSEKVTEGKAVAFTVSNLFAEVLSRLPGNTFQQEGSPRSSAWHMRQEIFQAEDRVRSNQQMKVRVVDKSDDGRPGLCVEWAVDDQPQDDNVRIEVQCHRVSRCSHLRGSLLIASDDAGQKRDCLPQAPDARPETRTGEPQPTTCRVRRVPFQQGAHCEFGLEEGEEYFFVLVMLTDPKSFVSMSVNKRVVAQPSVRHSPSASASAQAAYHDSASQSRSFSLEPPPDTLDLLALDTSRVYKAGNSENLEAFIVFKKGEPSHPEETRKRRRVD